ncbi:DNA polymerase III subunit gamma/tau [Alteromonas marina]|uniref:DNA polymerase III subunit gamma/tau n=1 Tax=Alteromonas sp. OM2203 TaxID=3398817 RepID=UPI003AF3B33B
MSYQVLARKWRPGKFSELVGQEHVVSAISNALDNDRLHHAYLFTGTRGVGKTTIARIFSKSLNCEEGQGANPCGVCNTCKEIEQGNYVDLLEIDAASRTKVEDTRELLDNVQYRPTRGRYKVYLIDEVHMLSKHSFNALLKTLEEPPPHVKFLLATTDPQKLPITILSRCLQFNLKAMSREQIVGQLQHILQQEQLPFEQPALALLARAAQGSMRDALSLTDQAIAQGGNQVLASVVTDMLGLMDKNQLLKVVHAVVSKSPADVLQLVNDIAEQAPDYDNVHGELASLLHQIALTQWVPEACKLETTSAKAIFQLAKTIPAEQVQLLYQIALQGRRDLPFAADGKSAFEMTLMRMMSFAPNVPIADTSSEIENGRSEHSLPVDHASSSGGPGNVGKQEEAPNSETPAAIAQEHTAPETATKSALEEQTERLQSDSKFDDIKAIGQKDAELHSDGDGSSVTAIEHAPHQPVVSENTVSQSTIVDSKEQSFPDVVSKQPIAHEEGDSATNSYSAPVLKPEPAFDDINAQTENKSTLDEPPLDAYMDEMPPQSEDDGFYGASDSFIDNESFDNQPASMGTTGEFELGAQNTGGELRDNETQPSLSAEEQLTSTADMLALRQKLKQKKAQDADAQNNKSASDKSASASDIQARFARSKAEASSNQFSDSAISNLPNAHSLSGATETNNTSTQLHSQESENSPEHENSVERENGPEQDSSPEQANNPTLYSSHEPEKSPESKGNQEQSFNTQDAIHNRGQNESGESQASVIIEERDNNEHIERTGERTGHTHSDLSPPVDGERQSANTETDDFSLDDFEEDMPFSKDEVRAQPNIEHQLQDAPPWATDFDNAPSQHFENYKDAVALVDNNTSPNIPLPEQREDAGDRSFVRDALDFDTPLSSTYSGKLNAFLNDGSKLIHASQIDDWSNLVEQMPVAGLLKQLVLHASFSRDGNQVSLEIDHSQTHLLNDSTKKQLVDAIHHGLGENVEVNITLGEPSSTPFALQQEIHAMRHAHAHTVIKTDETIQALLSTFDASVLTDSVKAR